MSSPWAKISSPEVSLDDIMSEEMAKELQTKEYQKFKETTTAKKDFVQQDIATNVTDTIPPEFLVDNDLESDAEIAKMLQSQFDKEYDNILKMKEDKFNATSKVSVSFNNYRRAPLNEDFESDSEEEELEDIRDRKDWDRFDTIQREFEGIPPCGYHVINGNMVTKHDMSINGSRNVCKMMSFLPAFETGDGACFDMKISNKDLNSLKMHWKQEQQRRFRWRDKADHATAEFGMDEYTRLLLYKLINNQVLERVNGVISIGKEAVVLHAETDPESPDGPLPKECVIKVFKTTLSEFKQRDKYIKDDYRFKDRIGKQNSRKTVHLWAEKEMQNLKRARRAGIPCPEVITLKKYVLVMSFIGSDNVPAPKLKDANLSCDEYILAYEQVVDMMKTFYTKANLIHADLSEYNILWHEEKCYFIDVSQSVEPTHENAFFFLMRDCENIFKFFNKKGVPGIVPAEQLFYDIVGCDFTNRIALSDLRESFKMKPHLVDKPNTESSYHFDNAWERSKGATNKIPAEAVDNVPIIEPVVA